MQKLRRALLRGRRADFWYYSQDNLVLRHPNGRDFDEIPIRHLTNDDTMHGHYVRLESKSWVSKAAIDELEAIAAGARR